jgi:hypothetical protein
MGMLALGTSYGGDGILPWNATHLWMKEKNWVVPRVFFLPSRSLLLAASRLTA